MRRISLHQTIRKIFPSDESRRIARRFVCLAFVGFVLAMGATANAQQLVFFQQFGTAGQDNAAGIAMDASGNICVVGDTTDAFSSQVSSGGRDIFVRKFDPNVSDLWTRQFGSSSEDRGSYGGIAVDGAGDVYVAGDTMGSLPGQTSSGNRDVFLRRFDSSGNELWTRQFGTFEQDILGDVASDAGGNTYLVGATFATFSGQTSAGNFDLFIAKYDPNGNQLWLRQFGTTGGDGAFGVALDGAGDAYVVGDAGTALPGQTLLGGGSDVALRKYDSNGNELWTRQFGTAEGDNGFAVAVDNAGAVYVTGNTFGVFPGETSSGDSDVFLRKYDSSGTEIWTRQFGTSASGGSSGYAVATDSSGSAYVTGDTSGAFAGQTSSGNVDAFVRKYDANGTEVWTQQFGSPDVDRGRSLVVDANQNVYVAGGGLGAGENSGAPFDAFVAKISQAVLYAFTGFFAPVDNPDAVNLAKAGRAIPIKFSLNGDQGLGILASGSPYSQNIGCGLFGSAPTDVIEETLTPGGTGLTYDPGTDRYVYVWKSASAWSGTCRQLTVKLVDGTSHVAYFKFK